MSCHCHPYGEEEEDENGYYELDNYDEFNGYNAEDEGDDRAEDACEAAGDDRAEDACEAAGEAAGDDRPEVGNDADTEIDYSPDYNAEYVRLYEADANNRAQLRDEIIYTQVFNNHKIPTETAMDLSLGSIEEWGLTCDTFNQVEKGLTFATIYIIYDRLVCNNIHPFLEMNHLTELFHSNIIHD